MDGEKAASFPCTIPVVNLDLTSLFSSRFPSSQIPSCIPGFPMNARRHRIGSLVVCLLSACVYTSPARGEPKAWEVPITRAEGLVTDGFAGHQHQRG